MDPSKRDRLEAAGWKVGSAQEFLRLSGEEAAHVEMSIWKEGDAYQAIVTAPERDDAVALAGVEFTPAA